MLFNSLEFLLFLAVVFALYWRLRRKGQNTLVALASYVFYGCWDWRFLSLILLSTVVDFVAAKRMEQSTGGRRRAWLGVSLAVNLGLLGVFKYLDFGLASMAALLQALGFQVSLPVLGLILPVGISFYTFQTLSYSIDVYRGRLRATDDFIAFAAFVAFFPQLVAGPIERATHLLGQFHERRRFDPSLAADGCRQMLWGIFVKTVVADNCARLVDPAYAAVGEQTPAALLVATWLFAIQIYADFSGYSHVAIGCARLFGFDLMRNFAYPYFSTSPAEFWHRWHISLSTWFRDYVYIPLGGSRVGPLRHRVNVVITFVVSGLWHGAGFQFLVWGLYHGVLVAAQWWRARSAPTWPAGRGVIPELRTLVGMLVMFQVASVGWVFFRSADLADAVTVFARWIAPGEGTWSLASFRATVGGGGAIALGAATLMLAVEWLQRDRPHGLDVAQLRRPTRWMLYAAVGIVIFALGRREVVPFIYFQF